MSGYFSSSSNIAKLSATGTFLCILKLGNYPEFKKVYSSKFISIISELNCSIFKTQQLKIKKLITLSINPFNQLKVHLTKSKKNPES